MWSKLALFLAGASGAAEDEAGLLTPAAEAGTTMLGLLVEAGGILMVVLFPEELICCRKLLGKTMIWP